MSEFETIAVRAGIRRSQFNEHAEALFLTSSFVFENAAQAAARFSGAESGPVYSRYTNPTVDMLQERFAALEGAECAVATASGMSAILALVMCFCRNGDHILASRGLFGATVQLFNNWLPRFGIETTFVSPSDVSDWERNLRANTKLLFVETPSNPLTEIIDIAALSAVARSRGALLAVDNCFCTPALQRPLALGADIVVHSATKYLDGQGRVLGGAVLGKRALIEEPLTTFLTQRRSRRLSPFNAWVILKGLETLKLRMGAHSANALAIAQWLEAHPRVERVFYPGLAPIRSTSSRDVSRRSGGGIVSFVVKGGREAAWRVVDGTQMISITANLGDTKTHDYPSASTTHGRLQPAAREKAGNHRRAVADRGRSGSAWKIFGRIWRTA